MKILITISLLLAVWQTQCAAQNLVLYGQIKDSLNTPVIGASIKVKYAIESIAAQAFCISNNAGQYYLQLKCKKDTLFLEVTIIGYTTYIERLVIGKDSICKKDITLLPSYKPLPTVNVTAIPKIIQKKDTTIFNADSYKTGTQKNIEDLLKNMPGFKIDDAGKITFNGKTVSKVLLENTDLFNDNYTGLTKNVGVDGVKSVEVINHYKDNNDLSKRLDGSDEQVINLKFKKGVNKAFGTASIGLPLTHYEESANIVSLFNKLKFVTTANTNNNGNLAETLVDNPFLQKNISLSHPTQLPYLPVTTNDRYLPLKLPIQQAFNNHSGMVSTNFQVQPVSSLTIKGVIQFLDDKFSNIQESQQSFFDVTNPVVINKNDTLGANNKSLYLQCNVQYTIPNKFQVSYDISANGANSNHNSFGQLQNVANNQFLQNRFRYLEQNVKMTYLVNNTSSLTFTGGVGSGTNPQLFTFSPFVYDSVFKMNTYYNNIAQQTASSSTYITTKLEFKKKIRKSVFNISISENHLQKKFSSNISSFNNVDTITLNNSNFVNANSFVKNDFLAVASFSSNITKKLAYTIGVNDAFTKIAYTGLNDSSSSTVTKNYVTPFASVDYSINTYAGFSVSWYNTPQYPSDNMLANGYLFTSQVSLVKGTSYFATKPSNSIDVNYHIIDLFKSKLLFFSGVMYNTSNPVFLNSYSNSQLYNYLQYIPNTGNSKNNQLTWFSYLQKTFTSIESQLTISPSISYFSSVNINNGVYQTSIFNNYAFTAKFGSAYDGWFNYSVEANTALNKLSNTNGINGTPIYTIGFTPAMYLKISKDLQCDVNGNYIKAYKGSDALQGYLSGNFRCAWQKPGRKAGVVLDVQNILNVKSVGSSYTMPSYSNTNMYGLSGRIVSLNLNYKF